MKDDNLFMYDWKTQEWLLIDWYSKLVESGDMSMTFMNSLHWMSNFLEFFKNRAMLGYSADESGIWFAVWVEPMMSGAYFGCWIRSDKRNNPKLLRLVSKAYNECFKIYPVLIGLSKQIEHRELHKKLGYKHVATIPHLWEGNDVDVHVLTREQWEHRKDNV